MAAENVQEDLEKLQKKMESFSDGLVKTKVMDLITKMKTDYTKELNKNSTSTDDLNGSLSRLQASVNQPKDILCLAFHLLFIEKGFACIGTSVPTPGTAEICTEASQIPPNWKTNAANGIFTFYYFPPGTRAEEKIVAFKCIFIGDELHVHASEKQSEKVFSLQLSLSKFLTQESEKPIKNEDLLRQLFTIEIVQRIVPPKMEKESIPERLEQRDLDDISIRSARGPAIPSVGRSDIYPSFGGQPGYPGMEVGPDHPIFGGGYAPHFPGGPVPGARFDPYGPPQGPMQPFPRRGPRGPPGSNFGPNPDHLRMPPDSFDGGPPPFGSGDMFS